MKWLLRLLWGTVKKPVSWWRFRTRIKSVAVEELPDRLHKHRLYLLGAMEPWAAALLCPCGCGEVSQLSLMLHDSPRWNLQLEPEGLATLTPSIWRTKGCGSHFFLRQGSVIWCGQKSPRDQFTSVSRSRSKQQASSRKADGAHWF